MSTLLRKYNLPDCYTESSVKLLESRFLKTNSSGIPTETPKELFQRVSKACAQADLNYDSSKKKLEESEEEFFDILFNLKFIPNSPTILNAGKKDKTLSGCFVLPVEDSLDSIYQTLSDAVQVQWKGGGTGFNFSNIRPKGDAAGGIPDVAAGPVHILKTFSEALMGIRQGGKRGGANMAILNIDHPDIIQFIHLKEKDRSIMNFNTSVGITNEFMEALRNDEEFSLVNPRTKKIVKKLNAQYIFNEIVELSHKTGDPGIAFVDIIDSENPTPHIGKINATNPCGEQPLLPYESCNLGHLNLRVHFDKRKKDINWDLLKDTIEKAVHFLDNIIDINYFPLKKIEKMTRYTNRKIGLGIMGFADVLMLKEIAYDSNEGLEYAEKIMKFIQREGIKASMKLAKKRGTFPAFKGSIWENKKLPVRNATITTIAPTGNTSIIGGSTGGIEPAYALAYKIGGVEDKNYRATEILFNVNESFKYLAKKHKFFSKTLLDKLVSNTNVNDIEEVPDKFKDVLVTALDIEPIWHLKMQSAFQKFTDNAISKTINFPNNASRADIRRVFTEAYKMKLKGVTIYRDGSKDSQTYVSTSEAKLNISDDKPTDHMEVIIASKDDRKFEQISKFLEKYNSYFKIEKGNPRFVKEGKLRGRIDEKKLHEKSIQNVRNISEKFHKLAIGDETGIFLNESKKYIPLDKVLFYGKSGEYSEKLYKKLLGYKDKGDKCYITTSLVIYDPANKQELSTITKIPGKLYESREKGFKHIFVHNGLASFLKAPIEDEFKSYHHRYTALQKVFEKFENYKEKEIDVKLSKNAYHVLEKRALKKDKEGKVIETPRELFERIATFVAKASRKYKYSESEIEETTDRFTQVMSNLEFLCGGGLIWAGMSDDKGKRAIWSKCFVLPIEDSIRSIFDTLNDNIEILRHGGGTGFNFSKIRSTHAKVSTTGEHAAGPVEYLRVFNRSQETIIGRGGRQMGSMAILNIDHPNIEEFIQSKQGTNELVHYNISVGISNKFMKALKDNKKWNLVDPYDQNIYNKVDSSKIFEHIAENAWKTGDPGVVFLDYLETDNPTPELGKIDATNVCGEQPLLAYESCNLGNINLSKIVKNFPYLKDYSITKQSLNSKLDNIDWKRFEEIIDTSVEFLDNLIDINNYPIPQIKKVTQDTRSIGLGIMGFSDMLIKLGIPYDSDDSVKLGNKIMSFLTQKSHESSMRLARKRGNFPAFRGSKWQKKGKKHMRNSRCTTVAPTGTISIVANCNPGIEPIFSLVFKRTQSLGGEDQIVVEPLFEKVAKARGFYSKELMASLADGKSLSSIKEIPKDVVEVFKTSHDIPPSRHVEIQAAFQNHCDSAVSKTINLPNKANVDDVKQIFKQAYELKCKGITIFRDGSKSEAQSLKLKEEEEKEKVHIEKKPRTRPQTTRGITTKVNTDQGSLFVTINEDENGIAEIFLMIGKSGGYSSGYCEAIGRLISVSLRAGLDIEVIIDQLKGIRTSTPTLNKGMFIYSVPDAVAKVLENYQKERKGEISMFKEQKTLEVKTENDIEKESVIDPKEHEKEPEEIKEDKADEDQKYTNKNIYDQLPECPDCGGDLEYAEGCMICRSCGYSKCG